MSGPKREDGGDTESKQTKNTHTKPLVYSKVMPDTINMTSSLPPKPKNNAIKVLLFDVGGVLVNFSGLVELSKLLPGNPSVEAVRARWVTSPVNTAFERGEMTSQEFVPALIEEFDLPYTEQDFVDVFKSWVKAPLPGLEKLLDDLRGTFHLACLSNTNEMHWDHMLETCRLNTMLDSHYASHLLGMIKPGAEIFHAVCKDLGAKPEEIIFFDDGQENVDGARNAGLHAYCVDGPFAIRTALQNAGLL